MKAVTEIAPLFIHKAVKIGVFIRYNYTTSHLRSIKSTCKNKNYFDITLEFLYFKQKLASLAQEICTLWFQFFDAVFASQGYRFKNISYKEFVEDHNEQNLGGLLTANGLVISLY